MNNKYVKDLMLSLEEYAVVDEDTSVPDAIRALKESQKKLADGKPQHRAVLVRNKNGAVVGKVGQLGFLKALEPKYNVLGDLELISKSGLDPKIVESMVDSFSFWNDSMEQICLRASGIKMKNIMRKISESIDEGESILQAMHKIVMYQTLSLLVTRQEKVIGILRLSDLFNEISDMVMGSNKGTGVR